MDACESETIALVTATIAAAVAEDATAVTRVVAVAQQVQAHQCMTRPYQHQSASKFGHASILYYGITPQPTSSCSSRWQTPPVSGTSTQLLMQFVTST